MGSNSNGNGCGGSEGPAWDYAEGDKNVLFGNLLSSGFESDLTLVFEDGREIRAHKLILMMRSGHFHDVLKGSEADRLDIPGKVDEQTVQRLLQYIYTGTFEVLSFDKVISLLPLAYESRVPGLVTVCAKVLGNTLTLNKSLPVFQAGMQFGNQGLIDKSLAFICKNAEAILDLPGFSDLRLECLIEMVQRDDFSVRNEALVFEAIYRWGLAECERQGLDPADNESLKMILRKPLKHVRFALMDKDDFVFKVAVRNVLDLEELVVVQTFFIASESRRSEIPGGRFISRPRKIWNQKTITGTSIRNEKEGGEMKDQDGSYSGRGNGDYEYHQGKESRRQRKNRKNQEQKNRKDAFQSDSDNVYEMLG